MTSDSNTSDASGAPSEPCLGAEATSAGGDSILPMARTWKADSVVAIAEGCHRSCRPATVAPPAGSFSAVRFSISAMYAPTAASEHVVVHHRKDS